MALTESVATTAVRPFRVEISDDDLDDLHHRQVQGHQRLHRARMPVDVATGLPGHAGRTRLGEQLSLVVAGAPGWGDAEGTSEDGVRFLGFVPERDLPAVLRPDRRRA